MSFSVIIPAGTRLYRVSQNACEDIVRAEMDEPGVDFATYPFLELTKVLQEPGEWEFASYITRSALTVKFGYADESENTSYFEPDVEPDAYVQLRPGQSVNVWSLLSSMPAPKTNGMVSLTGRALRELEPEMPVHKIHRDMLVRYLRYAYRLAVRLQDPNPLLLFAPYDIGLYIQRGILTPIRCEARVNPQLAGGRKRTAPRKKSRSYSRKRSTSRRKKTRSYSRSRSRSRR